MPKGKHLTQKDWNEQKKAIGKDKVKKLRKQNAQQMVSYYGKKPKIGNE